ncbi:MAG TPA: GntR family transcriptional regulator [Burkholderiaceae bacterium]|nr:GntR family transcriptional regulator [Burkholderiaceae bacterium]
MAAQPESPNDPAPNASASGTGATFLPLYQQIKGLITQGLEAGEWKPGELIPSETELATRFKVSQGTVRKAIDELANENLLVRRQGKGTFVASHHEPRAAFRFLRLVADDGEPFDPDSTILDCKRLRAPAEIARLLDLKPGDAAIQIRRLLTIRGKPIVLDDIWLPGAIFKGLTAEKLADYKGPMYALFESEFGTRMIRATERLKAIAADAASAKALSVASGTALLSVERVSFTYLDRPVEVRRGLYLTHDYAYRNELN